MRSWLLLISLVVVAFGCSPKSSERHLQEAYTLAKAGDWGRVLEISSRRVKDVPDDMNAKVLKSLALLNLESGKAESMEEAVNLMRQVVSEESERYDFQLVYGWVLMGCGRTQEAFQPLKKAFDLHIKLDKEKVIGQDVQGTIKYALGICSLKNKLYDDAIKYLEQAIKSTPYVSWPSVYSDIGCCYVCKGEFMKAMEWMNKGYQKANEINKKAGDAGQVGGEYPHMDALGVNMAVISDYLSWPSFNRRNSAAFVTSSVQWYAFASRHARRAYDNSNDANERASLVVQMRQLEARRVSQSRRMTSSQPKNR